MRAFNLLRGYAREATHWLQLAGEMRQVDHRHPILIYQMGKVGSSSVEKTLQGLKLPHPVFHVHTLSPDRLQRAKRRQRASSAPYLPEHLIASHFLVKKFQRNSFPCQLITLTREPVARAISFVFEDLRKQAPQAILGNQQLDDQEITAALNRLLAMDRGFADPGKWFDKELRDNFGINIYDHPYDLEKGFTLIQEKDVSLLVIRMEDINRSLTTALSALLDLPPGLIELQRANVGNKKWYADAMHRIKTNYQAPARLAEDILGTPYFKHFYQDQLETVRGRWISGELPHQK